MHGYNKLTIEIDDISLDRVRELAEENGYDDVDDYAAELLNNAIYEQDKIDFIVSLPKELVRLLDKDIKSDGYDSRSDIITFIIRAYYSSMGHFIK